MRRSEWGRKRGTPKAEDDGRSLGIGRKRGKRSAQQDLGKHERSKGRGSCCMRWTRNGVGVGDGTFTGAAPRCQK
jgi:hypothetical protein